jgi:hypothetical protein
MKTAASWRLPPEVCNLLNYKGFFLKKITCDAGQ